MRKKKFGFLLSLFFMILIVSCSNKNIKEGVKTENKVKFYTFTYKGKAKSVYMAGNFNGWKVSDPKFKLIKKDNEMWEITLPATSFLKGENEYKFIVDGEWVVDENAPFIRDTKLAGKIGVFKVE